MATIFSDKPMRRWALQILGLVLLLLFLMFAIWLIYDYQIYKLEKQKPSIEMKE